MLRLEHPQIGVGMSNQDELERVKKLRQNQLDARNPLTKEYKMQRQIASKYKHTRSGQSFFRDSWKGLDKIWKGLIYGAAIGVMIMVVLPFFMPGKTGIILGFAAIPLMMALGALFGGSLDWRDSMRDYMKK
jgi:hypothetical protein